ncbi:type II toxin-antitoxin system RnlB family antitoxin [Bacillus cereus]|uniref:type II toxin-antitoxin system RnlB family antitoxin n=1 Tax=Bacillus cereus group TaxID=86661 RepID=UPI002EDBAB6E|nr:type II toxin-antitoxin system RnlB family antitoxin [Bacillus cereus]
MQRYTLVQLNETVDYYPCMVLATSYLDPLESMEQISLLENDLRRISVSGKILFDMLSYIGDNSERYLTVEFNGEAFDLNSFEFVQFPKGSRVRKESMEAYRKLNEGLYNTVLNSNQIQLLLRGVAI